MESQEQHKLCAFVIMPFEPEFDDIYKDIIKPALEESGFNVRRADSTLDQRSIIKEIIINLESSDLIIAEVTSLNANVFYELGIAHAKLKPTVILTQEIGGLPFDLSSYRVIPYSPHYTEVKKLDSKLREIAGKLIKGEIAFESPVTDFAKSKVETTDNNIEVVKAGESIDALEELEICEEVELGWLDYFNEIENSMGDITRFAEEMTGYTKIFGQKIEVRNAELEVLKEGNGPGSAARMHKIAQGTGFDLIQYAKRTEKEIPIIHNSWERFYDYSTKLFALINLEKESDRETALQLKYSLVEFEESVKGALKQIEISVVILLSFKGVSRDLTRGANRVIKALNGVSEELTLGASYVNRITNLLDEKSRSTKP